MGTGDQVIQTEVTHADGTKDTQVKKQRVSPIRSEDPSILKALVDNSIYFEELSRRLAGWVQIPNEEDGRISWQQIGKPLMNERGRAWLISQLSSIMNKAVQLSNFTEAHVDLRVYEELKFTNIYLAAHLKEYEMQSSDTSSVLAIYARGVDAAYRWAIGDRARKHFFGALDESVNATPKQQGGLLGMLPFKGF